MKQTHSRWKQALLTCAACLLIAVTANAQSPRTWKLGPTVGFNMNKVGGLHSRTGATLGVAGEIGLPVVTKGLYIDWGAALSTHGWTSDWYVDPANTNARTQYDAVPFYLSIPIHIGYKISIYEDMSFFGTVGPYFAFGLWGKMKSTTETTTIGADGKTEVKTSFGTAADNVFADHQAARFDIGLGIKVGVEFIQHIQIAASYDFGLKNTMSVHPLGGKNKTFRLSYTYLF
jgi:hypothetical protein